MSLFLFCSCNKNDVFGDGNDDIERYGTFDIKYANDTLLVTYDWENPFDVKLVDWPSQRVLLESKGHKSEAVIALDSITWNRCGVWIETENLLYIKQINKR